MLSMCYYSVLLAIIITIGSFAYADQEQYQDSFSLHTTLTWREIPNSAAQESLNDSDIKEKWVWPCSLTIKSKRPRYLTLVVLQWVGGKIPSLTAGLYQKKERESVPKPIQENWICDGVWDEATQQLTFKLNEKVVAVNKYHLIISFPHTVERSIKKGSFSVAQTASSIIEQN